MRARNQIFLFLLFPLLLLSFQNCTPSKLNLSGSLSIQALQSRGGGSNGGFDGKVYVHVGECPTDPTEQIDAKIWIANDLQSARYLRKECVDVEGGTNIIQDIDVSSSYSVTLRSTGEAFVGQDEKLNTLFMATPQVMTAVRGDSSFTMNLKMDAVPMSIEGYQLCVQMLDGAQNSLVPFYGNNCLWPSQKSDLSSGPMEWVGTVSLPLSPAVGDYTIAVQYARFDSIRYTAVPMNLGSGVVPYSPVLVGQPYLYVIGTLRVQ